MAVSLSPCHGRLYRRVGAGDYARNKGNYKKNGTLGSGECLSPSGESEMCGRLERRSL
jgi:hypothetical protein